jgi:hypothetical protein
VKKTLLVLASLLVAAPAFAEDAAPAAPAAVRGKMLVDAGGGRLAPIYRVSPDGSASLIIDGHMVTVPASTISVADGKLKTTLTKNQVIALQ